MKKIFLVIIIINLFNTVSCKSKKEISMMIVSSYNGDNSALYWGVRVVNSDINFALMLKKYNNAINRSIYAEIKPLTKYKKHCTAFEDNVYISKIIHLVKEKKVRLLILAIPDKIKSNSKIDNVRYKVIDLENKCKIYNCQNYYADDFYSSALKKMNKAAIEKIVNEIEEIINKLD